MLNGDILGLVRAEVWGEEDSHRHDLHVGLDT
jgi:hypothetical protein